jgi:hypothetical protein
MSSIEAILTLIDEYATVDRVRRTVVNNNEPLLRIEFQRCYCLLGSTNLGANERHYVTQRKHTVSGQLRYDGDFAEWDEVYCEEGYGVDDVNYEWLLSDRVTVPWSEFVGVCSRSIQAVARADRQPLLDIAKHQGAEQSCGDYADDEEGCGLSSFLEDRDSEAGRPSLRSFMNDHPFLTGAAIALATDAFARKK